MVWIWFVSLPPKLCVGNWIPRGMLLGGGTIRGVGPSWSSLDHWGPALRIGGTPVLLLLGGDVIIACSCQCYPFHEMM
jgi:hypothetical protein